MEKDAFIFISMIFFAVLANLHFKPVSDNRIKEAGDSADELGGVDSGGVLPE